MNSIVRMMLVSVAIGVGAFILSFITMISSTPMITSVFCGVLYMAMGLLTTRMKHEVIWFAPLLMNIPIWIVFIPMGMEIWPPVIHIWYFLLPPGIALISAYVGIYFGLRILRVK